MITDYTQSPKVMIEEENTTSDSGTIVYVGGWGYWQTRLITRSRYEYRGLSHAAAIACAEHETEENTVVRTLPIYNPVTGNVEYINKTVLVANIVPSRIGDSPVWRVSVTKSVENVTFEMMGFVTV